MPDNRFQTLAKILQFYEEGKEVADIKLKLSQNYNDNDCREIWDACRRVLLCQDTIDDDHKFMKCKTRNGRKAKDGLAAVSAKQVYLDELFEYVPQLKDFNPDHYDITYGIYMGNGLNDNTLGEFEKSIHVVDQFDDDDDSEREMSDSNSNISSVTSRTSYKTDDVTTIQGLAVLMKSLNDDLRKDMSMDRRNNKRQFKSVNKKLTTVTNGLNQAQTDIDNLGNRVQNLEVEQNNMRAEIVEEILADIRPIAERAAEVQIENANNGQGRRLTVWGEAEDTANQIITKNFVVSVSKIPNNDDYNEDWLKTQQNRIFMEKRIPVTAIEVTRIMPTNPDVDPNTNRTKSFKVIIQSDAGRVVSLEQIYDKNAWVRNVMVRPYRRPRTVRREEAVEQPALYRDVRGRGNGRGGRR